MVAPSSLMEDRILLHNFMQGLYRTLPFILLVSGFGGYLLSRRALKPVDVLIAEARLITPDDLSRRLTVSAPNDQLRRLAIEWNSLLVRIDSAMIRVTQFTADASHELRNPVAYMRATAEYHLGSSTLDSDAREGFQAIAEEAKMTSDLLDNLLTLARLDDASIHSATERVDVRAEVADVVQHFAPLVRRKRQTLELEAGVGDDLVTLADAIHIRRVVTVLLDNAMKYTPEGGSIRVSCARDEAVRGADRR